MTEPKKRIIIADDHPIMREGLVRIIERDPSLEIVGQTGDGKEALALITEVRPDIALLDISMPSMNGLEIAEVIRNKRLPVDVIILTMYKDEKYFNAAMDLGIMGYVLKDSIATELLASLRAVAEGTCYISPGISELLIRQRNKMKSLERSMPGLSDLTRAERNVLKLIARSKTSKEIANELSISVRTVDNHRTNICTKLGIRGRNKLLLFAIENRSVF